MSDFSNETSEVAQNRFSETDEKVKNVRGIQGLDSDFHDNQLLKEKHLAQDEHDLSTDLQKFQDRPKPAYYYGEGLQQETEVQIQEASFRADQHGSAALEQMQQKDGRWAEPIKAMQDHRVPPYTTMDVMESFSEPPQVKKLTQDMYVNRYYGDGSEPINRWVTTEQYNTVEARQEKLALPDENSAENVAKLRIDKGATILEGKAAPRFGHDGGGNQIYVIDADAIHKVE